MSNSSQADLKAALAAVVATVFAVGGVLLPGGPGGLMTVADGFLLAAAVVSLVLLWFLVARRLLRSALSPAAAVDPAHAAKCPWCGRVNEGHGPRCPECGTPFHAPADESLGIKLHRRLLIFCGKYPPGFARRTPIFGAIALAAPLWALVVAAIVGANTDHHEAAGLFAALNALFWGLIGGAVSALIGLWRGERYRAFSYIGFPVDLAPVLWVVACWR